jgi:uroporphyrinogen-III synthase
VGPSTASALSEVGLEVVVTGDGSGGARLGQLLGGPSRDAEPIVLALAAEPRPELAQVLDSAGWDVLAAAAYVTSPAVLDAVELAALRAADVIIVSSPRGARLAAEYLGDQAASSRVVAIGPTTAQSCAEAGFVAINVSSRPGPDEVLEAVVDSCDAARFDA